MSRTLVSVPIPIQASDQHVTIAVILVSLVAWLFSLAVSVIIGVLIKP